jgi:hypothetical protein
MQDLLSDVAADVYLCGLLAAGVRLLIGRIQRRRRY